jgi:hypothetical protein
MKRMVLRSLIAFLAFAFLGLWNGEGPFVPAAQAQGKVRIAVLDKMPKAQSAARFAHLYPELSKDFRDRFQADGRFELVPVGDIEAKAMGERGVDPGDPDLLRRIGKEAGADVVFSSYYYEMGGHAMPMHSNNVLTLVWVGSEDVVRLDRAYTRVLSKEELMSSDALTFGQLLEKAETLLP